MTADYQYSFKRKHGRITKSPDSRAPALFGISVPEIDEPLTCEEEELEFLQSPGVEIQASSLLAKRSSGSICR